MKRGVLLCAVFATACGVARAAQDAPWFCRGSPCPEYTVVNATEAYETREYGESTWAFISQESSNFEVAISTALVSLLRYVREASIPVAKPVVARFLPDATFSRASGGFRVGFYLPNTTKDTAPIPTVEGVYLATSPRRTRFCFTFGGFATGGSILSNAARLALALTGEGIAYDRREFYFALYDISRVFGRHNEVLFDSASGPDLQQPVATS